VVGFATKFEPSFAKTFIPCWDEPRFKTTFNVTVKHPMNLQILFNTAPLTNAKQLRPDVGITQFKETPQMAIFLLGFVLGKDYHGC
jgi:aminopeptidase N